MSKLHRYKQPGQQYFVTCVTQDRAPILVDNAPIVNQALKYSRNFHQFELVAWVILPDHLHLMVDPLDSDVSNIIKRFKERFTAQYRIALRTRGGKFWQHRFWDHIIRDAIDHRTHLDYIHYNCVKHGYCRDPFLYAYSSAGLYLKQEFYSPDWGRTDEPSFDGDFGE